MYRLLSAVLCLVSLAAGGRMAFAVEDALQGVALVIGNSGYEHLPPLANPKDDARAVEDLLDDLGFETDLSSDRDARRLARDLEDFAEDAAHADVAILYYAGHGIEAGGENFMVPVDADLSALDAASERLVPTSQLIARLRQTVPVVIVLLDACRDNPFPPGAMVRVAPEAEPVAMAPEGLAPPPARGARRLAPAGGEPAPENLGIVLGFAAEPGAAALDGAPGEHSPYAAALLKHLSAGGYPFGDVMTMISEEVYLRTGGRQTPWMNTSLRRELRFGAADPANGEEAAIRGERRRLLLGISAIGQAERRQVEARAEKAGVPMDALFAMLQALGAEAVADPAQLDAVLRDQAERLKSMLAERRALASSDPEIARLGGLAETALREGALKAAIAINGKAKARVEELHASVDRAEGEIATRRREFAAVYARSAETYALSFDHLHAAEDYGRAYDEVKRSDDDRAVDYLMAMAEALADHGYYKVDAGSLERAVEAYREALDNLPADDRSPRWAKARSGLAMALFTAGEHESGAATLESSASILRETLAELPADGPAEAELRLGSDLGLVLFTLGWRDDGTERLREAEAVLRTARAKAGEVENAELVARVTNRLGTALMYLGQRTGDRTRLLEAADLFRASLAITSREAAASDWASMQNNLAIALGALGEMETGNDKLAEAVAAYLEVLKLNTRDRTPLLWAESQNNVATALHRLAERESSTERYEEAEAALRLALQEITRERSPLKWAAVQENLGIVLRNIGERRSDRSVMEAAVAALRNSLTERTRDRVPGEWGNLQNNLGSALLSLAKAGGPERAYAEAEAAFEAALPQQSRDRAPLEWAKTQNNLGNLHYALASRGGSLAGFEKAAAHYRLSLLENTRDRMPLDWALAMHNLGQTLTEIGKLAPSLPALDEAAAALEASRAVYREAGQAQYETYFEALLAQIELAKLQIQVSEKIRALNAAE
ncbi:caspase family protein [Aquibium oceanicum]|uniref:caspase family protein n=1 Tax=Aquibium oceanicum TaxID=1670800 RepID=UPI003610C290